MFSETGEMQPHSAWTHFNYVSEDESYGYIACCHCKLGFVGNDVRSMLAHMEERHPIINVDDLREVVESEQVNVEVEKEDVKSEGEESEEPPLKRIKLEEIKQSETACDTVPESTQDAKTLSLPVDVPLTTDQTLNNSIADSVTTAVSSADVKTPSDADDLSAEHTNMLFVEQHVSNKWKLVNRFTSFASMNAARRENRVYSQYSNRFHGLMRRYYRCSDVDCKYRMMSLGGSKEFSLFETEQHLEDIAQEQEVDGDDTVLDGSEGIKTPPPRSNRSTSPPSPPSPCLQSEPPSFAEDTPLVILKPEPLTSQQKAELMQVAKDQGLEVKVDAATGAFRFLKQSQFLRFQIKKVIIEIQYSNDKGKAIEDCFPNTSWGNLLDAIRKKCIRVFKNCN